MKNTEIDFKTLQIRIQLEELFKKNKTTIFKSTGEMRTIDEIVNIVLSFSEDDVRKFADIMCEEL